MVSAQTDFFFLPRRTPVQFTGHDLRGFLADSKIGPLAISPDGRTILTGNELTLTNPELEPPVRF